MTPETIAGDMDGSMTRKHSAQRSEPQSGGNTPRLSWQEGFSIYRKPFRKKGVPRAKRFKDSSHFEFVAVYPCRSVEGQHHLANETQQTNLKLSNRSDRRDAVPQSPGPSQHLPLIYEHGFLLLKSLDDKDDDDRVSPKNNDMPSASSGLQDLIPHHPPALSPTITYATLFDRLEPIFERYDKLFCVIPLTNNMPTNPFRVRLESCRKSQGLAHAVLALSCHHFDATSSNRQSAKSSIQILDHRQAALQHARLELGSHSFQKSGQSLLDAMVVLFTLDETQSAFGNWRTYLTGAHSILEACGGIANWSKDSRAVAQVGMLTWWDAVTAILSRTDCSFPYDYFVATTANQEDNTWSFFDLCGCPQPLVIRLIQLAHLAAEKRRVTRLRWTVFDTTLVAEIERSLENWSHVPSADAFRDEESMHHDLDTFHCSEAWRNGLLLYIYRVFWWKSGEGTPVSLLRRARAIFDHIFACRDDISVSKQAMLPLFLAGCELADQWACEKIVASCTFWSEKTGYRMFNSIIPLLREVWADQEAYGPENVWWGQVVDRWHSTEEGPLQATFTLG